MTQIIVWYSFQENKDQEDLATLENCVQISSKLVTAVSWKLTLNNNEF